MPKARGVRPSWWTYNESRTIDSNVGRVTVAAIPTVGLTPFADAFA
jgi:hypothetical protein